MSEGALLRLVYSKRRGLTAAYAAKLAGVSLEEARAILERLRRLGLIVKRGKFYGRPYGRRGALKPRRAVTEGLQPPTVKAYQPPRGLI